MLFGALFVVPLLVIVCSYLLLVTSLIRRPDGSIRIQGSSSAQESRPFPGIQHKFTKVQSAERSVNVRYCVWVPHSLDPVLHGGVYESIRKLQTPVTCVSPA
ncbi:uncharacterized protein LOC127863899 [Dreissena polymorpha]|uniref:uncharacterized protein LOC127863899 n=1 Tax=Dreissena polymorpha TaxID=45954 RepID=UPI002264F0DB|nr:uncharacterized protein LOC127863899 [Dreissena polymorpha]